MSACRQCGRAVITAVLASDETRIVLDAKPHPDGAYGAWLHRDGVTWTWRARHRNDGDRLSDGHLRRVHACTPADQQLDLGAA